MQGAVDAGGDDVDFRAVIDLAVAGSLVGLGPFGDVIMIGIVVKIVQTVMNILIGIIFKAAGDIFMEMDPILPVQEKAKRLLI